MRGEIYAALREISALRLMPYALRPTLYGSLRLTPYALLGMHGEIYAALHKASCLQGPPVDMPLKSSHSHVVAPL